IRGNVYFSVCDDQMCTPPETLKFSVDIDGLAQTAVDDTTQVEDTTEVIATSAQPSATDTTVKAATAGSLADGTESLEKSSLWELFIAGFVAGFIAFIMPCIYAMLPITV